MEYCELGCGCMVAGKSWEEQLNLLVVGKTPLGPDEGNLKIGISRVLLWKRVDLGYTALDGAILYVAG